MEKVLKDGKLYSLIEFRDKIYEDLDLSKSDLTTLLCAILIASIGLNMNSIPTIIGAMLISPLFEGKFDKAISFSGGMTIAATYREG